MTSYGVNLAASKAADAEAAKEIFVKYIALTETVYDVIAKRVDAIKGIEDAEERYKAMFELREYLEVTPVSNKTIAKYNELAIAYELDVNSAILSLIRDYRISPEAVDAYNSTIASLKATVALTLAPDEEGLEASLENILDIAEFLKVAPLSVDVINLYNDVLDGYTVSLKKLVDANYVIFVDKKAELDNYLAYSVAMHEKLGLTVLPERIDYEAFE